MTTDPDPDAHAAPAWRAAAAVLDAATLAAPLDRAHPAYPAAVAHLAAASAVYGELLPALAELQRHTQGLALARHDVTLALHAADLERTQQAVRNTLAHLHELPLAWTSATSLARAEAAVWEVARATGIRFCAAPPALVHCPSPVALWELAAAVAVTAVVLQRVGAAVGAPARAPVPALDFSALQTVDAAGRSAVAAVWQVAGAARAILAAGSLHVR